MSRAAQGRDLAARVLVRVWRDDAYAAAALSAELERADAEARERGLATELCYGVLRTEGYLARRVQAFGKLKPEEWELRAHLLVAVYQLDFLPRIPARAAVNEAVALVRSLPGGGRWAAFANAVLRRVSEAPPEQRADLATATMNSLPSWLKKRLVRAVGEEQARALVVPEARMLPTLRWKAGAPLPAWREDLEAIAGCPGAFRYRGGGDPRRQPEYALGHFVVQELGAQWIARALGLRSGHRVLDACAGRGQKATLLAELVGGDRDAGEVGDREAGLRRGRVVAGAGDPEVSEAGDREAGVRRGRVVATDLHASKVEALGREAQRLGVELVGRVHDWTQPAPPEWRGSFDRVLVDAPCTGVGTLRRRPEIARRLSPEAPGRLAELQATILRHVAPTLAPGGRLVFATCSVLHEEAEAVLEAVADVLTPVPFEGAVTAEGAVAEGAVAEGAVAEGAVAEGAVSAEGALSEVMARGAAMGRLLPGTHGTDGYFLACLSAAQPVPSAGEESRHPA